jgi:hypothetical protein
MARGLNLLFLAMAMTSFPADTSRTLQDRYGQPISETYIVKPGVAVTAQYGVSGHACTVVVKPRKPIHPLNNRTNRVGDYQEVMGILRELVPENERGHYVIGTFLDIVCAPGGADMDCGGVNEDWEKVVIHRSGSDERQHFAEVHWKRDECKDIYADLD